MWEPGEVIAWREVFRGRVWHALSCIVVKDSLAETVIAALPGAERMVEKHYPKGKKMENVAGISSTKIGNLKIFHGTPPVLYKFSTQVISSRRYTFGITPAENFCTITSTFKLHSRKMVKYLTHWI